MSVKFTQSAARRVVAATKETERQTKPIGGGVRASSFDSNFVKMKIITIEDDYLTCKFVTKMDGATITTGDTIINVAKPFELRRTFLDGTTNNGIDYTYTSAYEREADDNTNPAEDQIIVPAYDIHDDTIINCFQVFTGVAVGDNFLYWEDMNTAGRAWAVASG